MCGIAGYWQAGSGFEEDRAQAVARDMAGVLDHRGPDAQGVWMDRQAGIALVHTRLSIQDLSPAGAQPMHSLSGRYIIVFNGEIYNHPELRKELERQSTAPAWKGHSDTETLLAAIEHWGVEETLKRATGMFALALWDRKKRSLCLARDRMGEKPLYYGWSRGTFLFGSELKALCAFPGFEARLNKAAVSAYLRFSYVPAPHSIYENIHKLSPGHLLYIASPQQGEQPQQYWSLETTVREGRGNPFDASYEDVLEELEEVLSGVVSSQMLSDVPLGVFLSGGIDSSLIAALMQKRSNGSVKSFSIGFEEARFNEAVHAREVARHLGTEHTEFTVTEKDALDLVPQLPHIYDEPFADSSQLPTILLSRLTKQHVTVALSGDGGDEIFGGYNRYIFGPALWRRFGHMPKTVRQILALLTDRGQRFTTGRAAGPLNKIISGMGLPVTTVDRLAKFGGALGRADHSIEFYRELVSIWPQPQDAVIQVAEAETILDQYSDQSEFCSFSQQMMLLDGLTYLPDDILVKVDRASMSASLETRAPFLDRRVVEWASRIPLSMKIEGRTGKKILRDLLFRHVPRELIERPKQGFAIPLDDWLRGGLKEWAGDLLAGENLGKTDLLNVETISALWQAHLSGRVNAGAQLWSVLMLQAWLLAE